MMPEGFPRVDIGQMHFDERDRHRSQRVAQGDAGMGVAARVDDNESHSFTSGSLDAVDQVTLMIALEGYQVDRSRLGLAGKGCVDVRQRFVPVDFRLPQTQ